MPSSFARTYTTQAPNAVLDLDDAIGQRASRFRFDLVDIQTGYRTPIRPRRDSAPTLSHDISRTVVRQLTNVNFTVEDTPSLNVITSRVEPFMVVSGDAEFPNGRPLGRYMFNMKSDFIFTSGTLAAATLFDEGFIVDQPLDQSFGTSTSVFADTNVGVLLQNLLAPLPIDVEIAQTPYAAATAGWGIGASRGYVVAQLALDGDYFPPWFGSDTRMHFIRSFDPADALVTFDLDSGNRVLRDKIIKTNDLIDAPNRFIVISNSASAVAADVVGTYDVPSSAPHSIFNRGFVIPHVEDRQIDTAIQAAAVARNIGLQQTIFERLEIYTPPDPRHDSYDVLRWQGDNWLEIAWSMPLVEGADMQHVARKVYVP